ncbi:MAG: YdeI/OmpD-associated family protein [Croceitalea sp.]|nr:YdeI/OmpD-associated family protein [Croceitalea sp.]MBT8237326.1 YdeI/OmpD-associated family protein [Croceitalea sp.]NNC34296.1 YdeI/OmpD-associated family protein [Croceitalea sp.]NNL09132.1 YdeI/OmpD-associated family protein [Croceitalea sp.]NNM17643.1 YdeI/OmpD-associated family protein [Croceitalea sp.]
MHSIQLPEAIVKPFLEKGLKRVKVLAKFEAKELIIHAALIKRNDGYTMMFSKNNQKKLGIFANDYFELQFFEDDSKYGVEVPEEFEAVMGSDADALKIFESLTDGKKRGLIYVILRYKNPQLRIDKCLLLCENLKRGIRDPKALFESI